jgi:hypothetical protein
MHESQTPSTIKESKHDPIKKSKSLFEARQKHKTEKAKNDRFKKSDNFDEGKIEDSDLDIANKVPRLLPTKSSPVNERKWEDDLTYSIPSYRLHEEFKSKVEPFEGENWEVSRIEKNSEFERSFKKEMKGIIPIEEKKFFEVEKRLIEIEGEEIGKKTKKKEGFKKVSASPASEEKFGTSMITSHKDMSKNDLSRMMITVDQFIYVISGYKTSTLQSVERLNLSKGIWQDMSEVNIARTKFGSFSNKGQKIYLLGGKLLDGTRTDLIEEYDIQEDEWSMSKYRLPSPRSGFSNVLLNDNQLVVVGGNDGQVLDKMNLLNLSTGQWTELPPMKTKRDELSVAIGPDGKIYAIGGYGGPDSTCLKSVERFNFQNFEWEKVADMNVPRRALAAVSLPDGVYAIGGYNGSKYLASMERYDESQNKWIMCSEMNSPRWTLSAVSSNDWQYIYTIGGFDGSYMDVVERYDHVHDTWDYVTPMMTPRFMHSSCIVNVIRK